ncbi:unnamed protein product [Pleuronectes platessa]|uniref:Phosphatidylinositol transfer protein N-terminal domain-containing protein n=1 Tax=Pleuronectes platessa TaxID=8262 RepID=A0A9N7VJY3_PLEPL|nr:unnamed protein product [Pleuronectes platessa]
MISKHSHEQSERGEGVEVVQNEPYEDPEHEQASSQRNESTSTTNCPIGPEQWSLRFSMSQRRPGTITLTP